MNFELDQCEAYGKLVVGFDQENLGRCTMGRALSGTYAKQ